MLLDDMEGQLGYLNLHLAVAPPDGIEPADRRYTWTARTGAPDRTGRITDTAGWELSPFRKNPVIFASHGWLWGKWPIGTATDLSIIGDSIVAETRFASSREALDVQQLVDDGIVKAMSAAWRGIASEPIEPSRPWGPHHFKEQELLELSIVPIGDDPRAIRIAGFGPGELYEETGNAQLTEIQAAIHQLKESLWTPRP